MEGSSNRLDFEGSTKRGEVNLMREGGPGTEDDEELDRM